MRFKTKSGTEYVLKDVEMVVEATGEEYPSVGPQGIPVIVSYTGSLSRLGVPLRDLSTEGFFETVEEFHYIEFASMPKVGSRFTYYHPVWAGCYSTPITEIFEF